MLDNSGHISISPHLTFQLQEPATNFPSNHHRETSKSFRSIKAFINRVTSNYKLSNFRTPKTSSAFIKSTHDSRTAPPTALSAIPREFIRSYSFLCSLVLCHRSVLIMFFNIIYVVTSNIISLHFLPATENHTEKMIKNIRTKNI